MLTNSVEICILDKQAIELSLGLLQLQVVGCAGNNWLSQKAAMERIASKRFAHWEWRCNSKRALFPQYIADLDTGDCLVLR
jgi:hypothetical protein